MEATLTGQQEQAVAGEAQQLIAERCQRGVDQEGQLILAEIQHRVQPGDRLLAGQLAQPLLGEIKLPL